MFFMLASVVHKFHYLKIGLAIVLSFIGVKMLIAHTPYAISTPMSLELVVMILAISILASIAKDKKSS
jgi:tellurite resistance protein TerC